MDNIDQRYNGVRFKVKMIGSIHEDDSREDVYRIMFNKDDVTEAWMIEQDWFKFCEEYFPHTECHHSYDCCGQWYSCQGRVLDTIDWDGRIYLLQDWIMNV